MLHNVWLNVGITAAYCVARAFWRVWLGGIPHRGNQHYLVSVLLDAAFVLYFQWSWHGAALAGIIAVGHLAYYRALGHGPMLSRPLGPDNRDAILKIIGYGCEGWRWWLYAILRYPCFGATWALILIAAGAHGIPIFIASWAQPIGYWFTDNLVLDNTWLMQMGGIRRDDHDRIAAYGDHDDYPVHYVECFGALVVAAAIAMVVTS